MPGHTGPRKGAVRTSWAWMLPSACPWATPYPKPGLIHWGFPGWPVATSRVCVSVCASEWTWGWRGRPWLDRDILPEGIGSYDEVGITWMHFKGLGREVSMALACRD